MIFFDNLEWPLLKLICFEILSWNKVKTVPLLFNLLYMGEVHCLFVSWKQIFSSNWGNTSAPQGLSQPWQKGLEQTALLLHFSPLFPFGEAPLLALPSIALHSKPQVCSPHCTYRILFSTNSRQTTVVLSNLAHQNKSRSPSTVGLHHQQIPAWKLPQKPSTINKLLQENCHNRTTTSANFHLKISTGVLHHQQGPTWEHLCYH